MSEERELLELAAKAAGVSASWRPNVANGGEWLAIDNGDCWTEWNPITDGSDALQLAVGLRMSLFWNEGKAVAHARADGGRTILEVTTPIGPLDEHAAMRWSIVNCAAAIGKDMP